MSNNETQSRLRTYYTMPRILSYLKLFSYPKKFLIIGATCQMIREDPDYSFVILRHVSYPILKYLIFTLHKYGGIYSIISHTLIQLTPISFHKIIFFFVLCNNYLLLLQ